MLELSSDFSVSFFLTVGSPALLNQAMNANFAHIQKLA